ncbi:MAG TPA: hypothetical protein VD978_25725 [Azospirillum sp.]|nr:hypothetical protein [Azospirillum sp.]
MTVPEPTVAHLLQEARTLHRLGHRDRAIALLAAEAARPALALEMRLNLLLLLGMIEEERGNLDAAIVRYETASALSPGHGLFFSRLGLLRMRRSWSARLPPRETPGGDPARRVSMTELGQMGRFCDQLSQYILLRCYARRHDLTPEVPDWVGRHLFALDDPAPADPLPALSPDARSVPAWLGAFAGTAPPLVGHDLTAALCWALFGTDVYWRLLARDKTFIQGLFRPVPTVAVHADRAMAALRQRGTTVVAVHLRRGDFRTAAPDRMTSEAAVLEMLDALWPTLPEPVLYLASDEAAAVAPAFARFAPVLADDLAPPLPGADYFLDWYVLTQADVVAVSLSRFSWVAAQLNGRARAFYAPSASGALRPFNPWEDRLL